MQDPINRNAFIRLYSSGGTTVSLPYTGMREIERSNPAMILVPGENYFIYVNAEQTMDDLVLYDGANSFALGATITPVPFTGGTHQIADFIVPEGTVPDGIYVFHTGGYTTNPVEVVNDVDEANIHSAFFRISHNSILGDFYYPYVGDSFKQRIRMRCSVRDAQPETDFENYQDTSTGQMRSLSGVMKEFYIFETPDFSIDDHGAANYLSLHDNIIVNDRAYHRKASSPYARVASFDTPLSNGSFGLYDTASTVLQRC